MTASTLLEMAERDGVQVGFSPPGGLKASGPRDAVAKWLPELKEMKPAIAAAVEIWPGGSGQIDKWIFCLTPATLAGDQEIR